MSKLAEMIRASQTNERRHVFTPVVDFSSSVHEASPARTYPVHYVYELKATFGCNATIQHGSAGELAAKLKIMRRQVVEEIFGEFRQDIYAIQRALMNYDTGTATELVIKLHERMFDV